MSFKRPTARFQVFHDSFAPVGRIKSYGRLDSLEAAGSGSLSVADKDKQAHPSRNFNPPVAPRQFASLYPSLTFGQTDRHCHRMASDSVPRDRVRGLKVTFVREPPCAPPLLQPAHTGSFATIKNPMTLPITPFFFFFYPATLFESVLNSRHSVKT